MKLLRLYKAKDNHMHIYPMPDPFLDSDKPNFTDLAFWLCDWFGKPHSNYRTGRIVIDLRDIKL